MIELKSLTKEYRTNMAVRDLNLEVRDGEIFGIIGHNGAGKTTTLKMIVGLLAPSSGDIEVMNLDMTKNSVEAKRHIGYLPEESPLYENMTVNEYLMFFSELYKLSKSYARNRIDELLTSLKLEEKDRYTGELSKGMKRKVAIARTLLHDPDLLVLDEPNSGLDPLTSFFIIDYLKKLNNEGKTIVLSAHNLFHVEYICDRIAILKQGELVICDTIEAMREKFGKREYKVIFKTSEQLEYEKKEDNYIFSTSSVADIASLLHKISENDWALIDLSIQQSGLEEMYVDIMGSE